MTRRMCDELPPKRIPIAPPRAMRSTTCKLERRTQTTRAGKKKVGRRTKRTSMCDLPSDLVALEILTKVPITSLRAVRSTCKSWYALSKDMIFGKAAKARQHQFLGFTTQDYKVCSVRFHLCSRNSKDKEDEDKDLLDISIKQVDLLDQVKISRVFHCDGLLLCVAKDHSRLVIWNPYLGQTKCILFTIGFRREESYAFGYDINRNHKILRIFDFYRAKRSYEIYEFSSNSWRVLKVSPDPDQKIEKIESHIGGPSLKGNTYFYAYKTSNLLCFDFTTEKFGPSLPLPFHSDGINNTVALSCVRDEKLAVLYQQGGVDYYEPHNIIQIWITTTIEPNFVFWSQFLRVEMKPFALSGIRFDCSFSVGSFFIDEEEKVAVVFDLDGYRRGETRGASNYHTAFVIGEGGYFKSVSFEIAHKLSFWTSLAWPSYLPSLVQLNQPHKEKE